MPRPELLFVTPVVPRPGSEGRAMRAYGWLTQLSGTYDVHVLVLDSSGRASEGDMPQTVRGLCASLVVIDVRLTQPSKLVRWLCALVLPLALVLPYGRVSWVFLKGALEQQVHQAIAGRHIERLLVFRLYLHDIVRVLRRADALPAERGLDLDDLESQGHRSIGAAFLRRGRLLPGLFELSQAWQYRMLERRLLRSYRSVYLAAPEDAAQLAARLPGTQVEVFPNQLVGRPVQQPAPPASPLTLLFVGTLAYFPNEDAVLYLLEEVVPRLRQRMASPWRLLIVGRGASAALEQRCRQEPEVEFRGMVPEMAPSYADAHALVAPLSAGSGTKIKVLEAFLYGRPVITSEEGVRGLAATPGVHYIPASSADEIVQACLELAAAPERGRTIADAAQQLLAERFLIDAHPA